jgi:hypothetical protein
VPDTEPPAPPPPSSSGGSESPAPSVEVAPSEPSGPTAAELAQQRREELQRQRELERQRLVALRKKTAKIRAAGLNAFDDATKNAPRIVVPEAVAVAGEEEAPPVEVPIVQPEPAAEASPALAPQASEGSSSLSGAAPVLLGLLGLAILLLGVAALPPWTIRSAAFAGLLATRRLEIGLIGAAVLASAAIGLAIAVVAG